MTKTNNKKQIKKYYTPVILSCTGALAFKTYLQIKSARLGDNSHIIQLSQSTFFGLESTPMNIGFVFMLIFLVGAFLLYPLLSNFCYKTVEQKILKEDFEEKIIFAYRPLIFVACIPYALSGYFLGCYILPLLIFPNITHIDMVSQGNLLLYILFFLAVFLFALAYQYNSVILTNKRIINSFIFFPPWTKNMFLNDIKRIQEIDNTILYISKTEENIGILRWRKNKLNIFKQKLRAVLQKTRRIIDGYSDECA